MSFDVRLPGFVFEQNLVDYVQKLLRAPSNGEVTLDFEPIKFFISGAVVATLAQVRNWCKNGQTVYFRGHQSNPVCGYLQRIDFFEKVGLELREPGRRRNESGRFVPIEQINELDGDAADIASKMAECVSPGGYIENDAYQLAQYACGEIVTNCKQHARGHGFISAQYSPKRDTAWIAIADCGRGIRKSFKENRSLHFRPGMSDAEAIQLALEPRVSSTTHIPHMYGTSPNKGVGLSMVRHLMRESLGYMVIISGRSWFYEDGNKSFKFGSFSDDLSFEGTICSVSFKRDQISNYNAMLREARTALGLTRRDTPDNIFL